MAHPYIGVDLSKDWLDVCDPAVGEFRLGNTLSGLRAWCAGLPRDALLVFEATSGCDRALMQQAARCGIAFARVNPARARFYGLSLGRAKTDRVDARMLAAMGRAQGLSASLPPSQARVSLAELVRRRNQLKDMETQEKQHLSAVTLPALAAEIRTHLEGLKRRIAEAGARIEAAIAADPGLSEEARLLRSAPGIGPVIAAVILAHLPELGRLTRREIASLGGLAPQARDSGKWAGKRRIGGGRRQIRRALYQAALVIHSHKRHDRAWIENQLSKGKAPKAMLIALARRLLCRLNAMLRDQKPYHPPA